MSVTVTKSWSDYATLEIEFDGVVGASTSPSFLSEGLPWGTVLVVLQSGTVPTSVALQGSNDGVNFVQLGTPATGFPAAAALAASLGGSQMKYYNFAVNGGDTTTKLSFYITLMGNRG